MEPKPLDHEQGLLSQERRYNSTIPAYLQARAEVREAKERIEIVRAKVLIHHSDTAPTYDSARIALKAAKRQLTAANNLMCTARREAEEARWIMDIQQQNDHYLTISEGSGDTLSVPRLALT